MRDPQFVENPCLLLGRHKAVIASDCFGASCMNFRKRPNGSNQPIRAIHGVKSYDSYRCTAGPGLSATSVSNTAGMPPIERQLYGTSTVKIFLLPGS